MNKQASLNSSPKEERVAWRTHNLRMLAESETFAQVHEKLRNSKSPVAQLVRAAANEIRLSSNLRADGLKERIAWQSERIEMAAGRRAS